jgi:putative transposase
METRRHMRERRHRLPRRTYRGTVAVSFVLCVAERRPSFAAPEVVGAMEPLLVGSLRRWGCVALIFCFMPGHAHVVVQGRNADSDTWGAVVGFKYRSGLWFRSSAPETAWQKGFYDHILWREDDVAAEIRYIAANPVRAGLVEDWREYPFTGRWFGDE